MKTVQRGEKDWNRQKEKEWYSWQEKKSERKHEVREGQGRFEEHEQTILLKEGVCRE